MSTKNFIMNPGPASEIERNLHGSKGSIVLVGASMNLDINRASRVLAECGISLSRARQAVEQIVSTEAAVPLVLPKIFSTRDLFADLRQAGIAAVYNLMDAHSTQIEFFREMIRIESGIADISRLIAIWNFGKDSNSPEHIGVFLHNSESVPNGFIFAARSDSAIHRQYLKKCNKTWVNRDLDCLFRTVALDVENAARYDQDMGPMTSCEMFVRRAEELDITPEKLGALWNWAEIELPEDSDDAVIHDEAMRRVGLIMARKEAMRDDFPEITP